MNLFQLIFEERIGNNEPNRPGQSAGVRRSLAFTLIELLVVISIIALLASLVVGLARNAGQSNKRGRIQAERDQVITAIEAYKAHFGHYPPDNVVVASSTIVNPVTNQLFYELTGVIVDDRSGGMFRARDRQQGISSLNVQQFFHRDGFENAGTNPKELKSFLPSLKASQRRTISTPPAPDIEVLAVSVDWPNDPRFTPPFNASPAIPIRRVIPWRYVKTNPTNNPDSFDLWAEFVEGGKIKVICNWSKEVLDR
jgi:prepilin-type N-terminal cleavage/methylation domain-containing protein